MKKNYAVLMSVAVAIFLFAPLGVVRAQRLHDEGRDAKAQEAAKLAEEITTKATFENQLKNLETFSKRDAEVHFRAAKRQMDLEISGFRTWGKVSDFVDVVKGKLNQESFIPEAEVKEINKDLKRDCGQRITEFGKSICDAQKRLADLKKLAKESEEKGEALEEELKVRLEKIAEIETLVDKAESFLKSDSSTNETIKGLSGVFINLSNSFVNYENKLQMIRNQPTDELKLLLQRIAVETLQVEADHWKTVGEIQIRRAREQKDMASMVRGFENRLLNIAGKNFNPCPDPAAQPPTPAQQAQQLASLKAERIDDTFAKIVAVPSRPTTCPGSDKPKSRREIIEFKETEAAELLQALHLASALAARGETPADLADLRLAQEEQRYSIRQSAVAARGYELALSSGTKRLARYYAGGLKPEKIAQLIHTVATVAIPSVIAGK